MNFIASEFDTQMSRIQSFGHRQLTAMIAKDDGLPIRTLLRVIDRLRDEKNHDMHLREDLRITIYPPRESKFWRVVADVVGPCIVGRGETTEIAIQDWKKRFRKTTERLIEMRPFEMTKNDTDVWNRIQNVINVPQYKATKPMVVRQVGKISEVESTYMVVKWEDGKREKVCPDLFDEVFARFKVGQPFEAIVTRHSINHRIIRADAVRKLPAENNAAKAAGRNLWAKAKQEAEAAAAVSDANNDVDEGFWIGQ